MVESRKSYDELKAIPIPDSYGIYRPVSYCDHIDMIRDVYWRMYGLEPSSAIYGTNKSGTQMFGVMDFDLDDNGVFTYSHGFRGSYDKSISNQSIAGASVFVCSNMMMDGDTHKVARKNTVRAYDDLRYLLEGVASNAQVNYRKMQESVMQMQNSGLSETRGYQLLGEAIGTKAITPTVANVAFEDWRNPRHEEFAERNVWSLYNGCTEGLKKVAPSNRVQGQVRAHKFFDKVVA